MEMRALISLYKDLYKAGKITGAGVERHNELVKKYRKKLMESYDSKTGKRIKAIKLIEVKLWFI